MSRQKRRKPLPPLTLAQLMERQARRLCTVAVRDSGEGVWTDAAELRQRLEIAEGEFKGVVAFAVGRGWFKASGTPIDQLAITRLGIIIAADQRVDPPGRGRHRDSEAWKFRKGMR